MRIVVRTPNWLGDLVMALPAIEALRARCPDDTIAAATPAPLAPIFDAVPAVDEVVPLPGGSGWREWHAQAVAIRAGRFDATLLLPNSFQSAWVAWWAGVRERWGYRADGRRWLLTRSCPRPRAAGRHVSETYLELVAGLAGADRVATAPRMVATSAQRTAAARRLADRGVDVTATVAIAVAPGAAYGSAKRWPAERFAGVVAALLADPATVCLLVGAAGDRVAGDRIESWLAGGGYDATRVVNLIGQTDLSELIGVLIGCRRLVSNDSGAMHLGAALGLPVTAVFGPTDERHTGPLGDGHTVVTESVACRPCGLRTCPIDHRCMTRISIDRVSRAVATAEP